MRGAVPNAVFPLLEINGNSLAGLTAAAGDYHFAERGVERLLPEQLLQREVHAVAPVIAGRGRDVDALPVRMGLRRAASVASQSCSGSMASMAGERRCMSTMRRQIHGSQVRGASPSMPSTSR